MAVPTARGRLGFFAENWPLLVQSIRPILRKTRCLLHLIAKAKELDELRWINRALADGEARIRKEREIIADLDVLSADPTVSMR